MDKPNTIRISSTDGGLPSAVRWSHLLIEERLRPGDLAVDATAGNGHDTLFLARLVSPGGHVFAFDVQERAIASARELLLGGGSAEGGFTLIHAGHETLGERLPAGARGRVQAVMFNLGYLPGSDKKLITETAKTLSAIPQALEWLSLGGIMTVIVYPGHEGGASEAGEVEKFATGLSPREIEVQHIRPVNRTASPPECWVFWKRGRESFRAGEP